MGTSSGSSNPSVSACSRIGPRETAALARSCSGSSALPAIGQQHIGQIIVDHCKITRELGGDQAVGFTGSRVSQNPPKRLPGISWPVPWRGVEKSFKVHYGFLSIAINYVTPTAGAVTDPQPTWYSGQNWCSPLAHWSIRVIDLSPATDDS